MLTWSHHNQPHAVAGVLEAFQVPLQGLPPAEGLPVAAKVALVRVARVAHHARDHVETVRVILLLVPKLLLHHVDVDVQARIDEIGPLEHGGERIQGLVQGGGSDGEVEDGVGVARLGIGEPEVALDLLVG